MSKKDPAPTGPPDQDGTENTNQQRTADGACPENGPSREELIEAHRQGSAGLSGESPEAEEPVDSIESLRAELEDAKEQVLRRQAELENYRRRVNRQMDEERKYANMGLLRDMLPVWDNIRRAIEAAEQDHDAASLLEGFKIVFEQFEAALAKYHCRRIAALDSPFDPHLHEAISQQPSSDHPANSVMFVTQTGFCLHDRVVRPSQVVVSAAPPADDDSSDLES